MATRFAVASTAWNTPSTWDNGAVPVPGDTVYPNGYTVTIDTDINVASLNNNATTVSIPNIATPVMTSNTQPTGTVISSNNAGNAYVCFNQDGSNTNYWTSGIASTGWIGYTFPTGKVIKRYIFKISTTSQGNPKTWTFEGSNDNFATFTILDSVPSYTTNANYTSGLVNTSNLSFTSYRINVTAVQGLATVILCELEMTESTVASPVYGGTTGGSFTVPSSLSGTRNIVQSGAGLIAGVANCLTFAHTGSNMVNLNTVVGGYITNPTWGVVSPLMSHNGTGILNINGDLYGSQNGTAGTQIHTLTTNAASTVNITGNIYSPRFTGAAQSQTINCLTSGATFNVIGNFISTSVSITYKNQYCLYIGSSAANITVNLTGNATGDTAYCIVSDGTNTAINAIGTITVVSTNSQPAITLGTTGILTASTPIINVGTAMAILVFKMRLNNAYSNSWTFVDQTNASRDLTFGTPSGGPYPLAQDVRLGVTYAASPTRTGTCAVPLPQYVSQGVATGSTVGTAYLNAADVWNIQTSTLTTAGSIGERLKNASTVQTNGDQLASYIV